jgi:Trypsin-like peptidase domain
MPLLSRTALPLIVALMSEAPAAAQEALFDPYDYGKANLPVRQNTGDAAAFIAASEGGAFEPIVELSPNDQMAFLARPIGRVDVLLRDKSTGEQGGSTCTGSLLGGGLVLTNDHCLPQEGSYEVLEASILMNYHTLDGVASVRFAIDPVAIENSFDLDYAIARVDPLAEEQFGHIYIGTPPPDAGSARVVIHHPLGKPKVMSRFRCLVLNDRAGPPVVAHRCDTLPGSSGSLLFDERGIAVALHRGGGLDPADPSSFNMAIDFAAILQVSQVLGSTPAVTGAAAAVPAPDAAQTGTAAATDTTPADDGGALSTDQMNDILKGE